MLGERAFVEIGMGSGERDISSVGRQQGVELLRQRHSQHEHFDLMELTLYGARKDAVVSPEVDVGFLMNRNSDDLAGEGRRSSGKGALGCQGIITAWLTGDPDQ
jgi:hypothetical protein